MMREEWKVTGEPGAGYPSYRFVFHTEAEARTFVDRAGSRLPWREGPFLAKRVITETEWEDIDA